MTDNNGFRWDLLHAFVDPETLETTSPDAKVQALMDALFFWMNMSFSLIGAILVGSIAYFIIHRNQKRSLTLTSNKDRLELLHGLEQTILFIHSRPCVFEPHREERETYNGLVELRSSLDDREWNTASGASTFLNGGRMWQIRSNEYAEIDSRALHETLIWFRRVERGLGTKLVDGEDLFRLWRQILPFVIQNRYVFFSQYFSQEVQSLRNVAGFLIGYCQASPDISKDAPLKFLREPPKGAAGVRRIDEELLDELARPIRIHGASERVRVPPVTKTLERLPAHRFRDRLKRLRVSKADH